MQEFKALVDTNKFIDTYLQVVRFHPEKKKTQIYEDLERLREYAYGARKFRSWSSFSVSRLYHTRKQNKQQA